MLKKIVITSALVLQGASLCFAQASAPAAPASNPHQSYDRAARDCKKQAAEKQLNGEESRVFIAQCMKPAKAP
jgi:hypothetical protein